MVGRLCEFVCFCANSCVPYFLCARTGIVGFPSLLCEIRHEFARQADKGGSVRLEPGLLHVDSAGSVRDGALQLRGSAGDARRENPRVRKQALVSQMFLEILSPSAQPTVLKSDGRQQFVFVPVESWPLSPGTVLDRSLCEYYAEDSAWWMPVWLLVDDSWEEMI